MLFRSTIWIVVTQDVETGEMLEHYSAETLEPLLRDSEGVIGHNIIGFDAPVLEKQWSLQIPKEKLKDTLVLSRLWNPSLEGGHSLDSWGKRFGDHKIDFHDYDGGLSVKCLYSLVVSATSCLQYSTISSDSPPS